MPVIRKRHIKGINLDPVNLSAEALDREGDLALDSNDSKLKYRDGSTTRTLVNLDEAQTISSKTLDTTNILQYDNMASGLTATTVKAALDELKTGLDNQNEAIEIVYDPTNNPETTALNVQDALDDTGVASQAAQDAADAAQLDIDNHIANTTGAHAASAISNIPLGNLDATDVQTALNELQSDIDIRALADMGTITNASIETPRRLDVRKSTESDLLDYVAGTGIYLQPATNGQIVFDTDNKKMFQIIDGALEPIGAGGATQFEVDQAAHGLLVGQGIYHNGTSWVVAQANDANTLASYVVVESSINKFVAADFGRLEVNLLTNPDSLVAGEFYYLSDSVAGQPTALESGLFSNPLFYVESIDATDPNNQLAILQVKVYRPESVEADELFPEVSQAILDNQSNVSVSGIALDTAVHRGLSLSYSTFRTNDEGLEVAQIGQLRVVYKFDNVAMSNVFSISDDFAGDDSGIEFSVDATGQLQYTSTALGGTNPTGALKIKGSEVFFQ